MLCYQFSLASLHHEYFSKELQCRWVFYKRHWTLDINACKDLCRRSKEPMFCRIRKIQGYFFSGSMVAAVSVATGQIRAGENIKNSENSTSFVSLLWSTAAKVLTYFPQSGF